MDFIDGSYAKAHQHSAGAAEKQPQGIGKSRVDNTTKIHLAVDGYGLPCIFEITGAEVSDNTIAPMLLDQLPEVNAVIAYKGSDSESIRKHIEAKGGTAVIPRRRGSTIGNEKMDWGLYKYHHLVENSFACLKHFKVIATRYDNFK